MDRRREENRFRELVPVSGASSRTVVELDGRTFLNFCSNDYLGLAHHPEVIERSLDYTRRFGAGSSASRLVSGSLEIHHRLEEKIAKLYGSESALLFGSGFQANLTILPALTGRNDVILADKRCHNSLIQGGLLGRATFRRFRHNDMEHLEELLIQAKRENRGTVWIVSETLFSMDGDEAPVGDLIRLRDSYHALLYLDDAHAFGVLGPEGLGMAARREGVDLLIGTLGKAGGAYGAFVVCGKLIRDMLVNYCSGFIYTTAPPPGVVGAADAAFELIPGMERERERLRSNSLGLRTRLRSAGFDCGAGESHIIPLMAGSDEEALELSRSLYQRGFFLQAIRPPTVETSRLRMTLSAEHSEQELNSLIKALIDDST
ncbi:MAG: 8-amino-7-oxononanoate synthase [Balneolaceae bacterium]